MLQNIMIKYITVAIILISVVIIFSLGLAEVQNIKPQIEDNLILNPPLTTNTPDTSQLQPESTISTLELSGTALTCTKNDAERVVDLRIVNHEDVIKSITISPGGKIVKLLPKEIKRIDISIPSGISNLILVSDNGKEVNILVPSCIVRGGSDSKYFAQELDVASTPPESLPEFLTGTPTPSPTGNPPTPIPEFPSIMLPVISLIVMLFILQKRK